VDIDDFTRSTVMSTQFEKLKEIFLVAVEKESPAERAGLLDQACAGNAVLRSRLEALLDADALLGAMLDRVPGGLAPTAQFEPIVEQPGSLIGSYKLLQKIGEGGMGLVFMAEQQRPVKRKVALKIIKPGMDTKQVVARFEAERQALALMNHPHIAQVFDAGETESGRPYFVMELVRGVPITEYCDQNNLTPRERLELFVPVCQAVQHAHQKGVIHRDIKPTNVLVTLHDGKPVPKVIDFGVSKAIHQEMTERTLFTNFAQMVGTPLYMSPEQAEMSGLDIDTRADIYSLGVLLYELLTGQTPFDGARLREAAFDEIRRIIREEEPLRPSTRLSTLGEALTAVSSHRKTDPARLSQLIRGDLDWIVMKSLEKDRTRRYGTASEFAADIERHLNDEPVVAGPPSVTYRLRKFARKHRGPVAAASAVFVSLALGLAVSLVLYAGAERLRHEAENSKFDADQAREAVTRKAGALQDALGEVTAERNLKNEALAAKDVALNRSEALRLTTHSANVLPRNPGLALLLATEAARRGPRLAPVNNAIFAALAECREVRTLVARPSFTEHEPAPLAVYGVSYSRDGSRVITLSGGTIHRSVTLNTRTDLFGTFIGQETLRSSLHLEVGTAQIWEAATGRLLTTIEAPPNQRFSTVEISPNSRILAATFGGPTLVKYSGGETHLYTDRVVRLYNIETGHERHTLRGHTDHVVAAVFSPDSRRILTASHDKTVRLWDVSTGAQVPGFRVKSAASLDAAEFSPDGRHVLTLSRGFDQSKEYADNPKRNDAGGANWKIDPPAGERDAVRALQLAEDRNWSRDWKASMVLPGSTITEADARPGARLWDAENGAAIPEPTAKSAAGASEEIMLARFNSNGRSVVTADRHGTVVIRAVDDRREALRFTPRQGTGIRLLELSRDGRHILICFDDDALAVYDFESGEQIGGLGAPVYSFLPAVVPRATGAAPPRVRGAFFDADSRRVFVMRGGEASAGSGIETGDGPGSIETGAVAILDAATMQEVGVFRGHSDEVIAGCLSPDGRNFATASLDGTARIWDVGGPEPVGTTIAATRASSRRSDERAKRIAALETPTVSQNGRFLVAASIDAFRRGEADDIAQIIDVETGAVVSRLVPAQPNDEPFFKEGLGGFFVTQFSPDGRRLLTVSADRHVRVIKPDIPSNQLFAMASEEWPVSHELPFKPVRVWDVATGRELFHLTGLKCAVNWASFSPDGRRILTRSTAGEDYCYVQPQDGTVVSSGRHRVADPAKAFIHVWDAANGRLYATVRDVLNPTHEWEASIAWRPDSHSFVAGSILCAWIDVENRKLTVIPGVGPHNTLLLSPDGKYLLSRDSDQAMLLDVSAATGAGAELEHFELAECGSEGEMSRHALRWVYAVTRQVPLGGRTSSIIAAAFSSDNRLIAATTADHAVQIWDVETGALRYVLRGHIRPAPQVCFSGDGHWLVTASDDRTARVWDVTTGAEFVTLQDHRRPVRSAVFSPDSQSVITSSADGTVRRMPIDPLKIALTRKPRELTPEERARYEVGE
jgi:WD40 repeat protein/serine/threonine protein kinase